MKPLTLAELRARQKEQGLVAPRDDDEGAAPSAPPVRHEVPAARFALPVPVACPVEGRGFICYLPPQYPAIASLPPGWVELNWRAPSPWCRVEGLPDHPDFAGNLEAWEDAQ